MYKYEAPYAVTVLEPQNPKFAGMIPVVKGVSAKPAVRTDAVQVEIESLPNPSEDVCVS